MNLTETLLKPESKTLEFKRNLSSPNGFLRTIVAFANTAGGTVVIGVEDGTHHVCGITNALAMEERVASLISDSIAPHLLPDIEILNFRNEQLLAVEVYPSPGRPHFLKSAGPKAGVLVRVGSTNRHADAELIAELRRYARGEAFDEQPLPDLNSEAIDFRVASEYFAEHLAKHLAKPRKLKKSDLKNLRLVTSHQRRTVPTVGGVLLFGRDRLDHFPDAWIQAGRFAGANKAKIIDHRELKMPLIEAISTAVDFVEKHTMRGVEIGPVRSSTRWTLPPMALREAIINAVVHTDYSQCGAPIRVSIFNDRLEVENPGLLPPGLTLDDLPQGVSKLRNRVIGRIFHELGLVEQWGSGIQRMISACRDAGLPPPVWEEVGIRLRVTFSTHREAAVSIDGKDKAILSTLDDAGLSTSEIATEISLSPRATRTRLLGLIDRGMVREIGTGVNDPKRRYFKVDDE